METATKFEGKIGTNQIIAKGTDSLLRIEVVNPKKLGKYFKELSNCQEITMSPPNLISTTSQLLDAIKNALSLSTPQGSIKFDEDSGSLILQNSAFGMNMSIIVKLEKESPSEDAKYEFLLRKIDAQPYGEILTSTFNAVNKQDFTFSDDLKTVTMKTGGAWKGVVGNTKFSGKGKQSFSVKLVSMTASKNIMIGVATHNTDLSVGCYTKPTGFMVHMGNGQMHYGGWCYAFVNVGRTPILVGDAITVTLDMDTSCLSFEISGIVSLGVGLRIGLPKEELCNLCPAVDLFNATDSVSFVWNDKG